MSNPTLDNCDSRTAGRIARATGAVLLLVWIFGAVFMSTGCAAPNRPDLPASHTGSEREAAPAPPQFVTPPFFRIDGGDGAALLMLGTIHLGPAEGWPFSPAMRTALRKADSAILELDPKSSDEETAANVLAELAILPSPTLLPDVISPETAKLLEEQDATLGSMGIPHGARIRMKPWYITAVLLEVNAQRSGYSMSASVDQAVAEAMGERPIVGLETIEEQLRFFDAMKPEFQDLMLRDTLANLDAGIEQIEQLVSAWRIGDESMLLEISREGVEELPELAGFYDVLLRDRNFRWIEPLRRVLDEAEYEGQTIVVAVGALHLVGPEGLPALLRDAGYRVESVSHSRSSWTMRDARKPETAVITSDGTAGTRR
ncbi:MAG: hypothetical protein CL908_17605 [Deltaproteobacteria bacterium]|nr:hypothetical protein [Deltaproteobacteria bacterium]